ncbi:MAG: ATP-binding cassette domain-containing protein [Candidatus Poseidoniales archaeon]|nr:ATP-binding cassette domain-containing protein [Candidatus Poseidoniales archaeon]
MSEVLLSLNDVTVRRGSSVVLKNLYLQLEEGQIALLSDKNGAGKSTIIESAAGLLPLETGEVSHHSNLLIDSNGRSKRPERAFGLTLQSDGCIGSQRVEEHIHNALDISGGRIEIDSWLKRYNLAHRKHDLIAHLSGGQRRKVAMLAGILPGFVGSQPRVLLLDEPAAGLDEASRATLVQDLYKLQERGNAILLASHHADFNTCATHIFHQNKLVANESATKASVHHEDIKTSQAKGNVSLRTSFTLNQRTLSTVANNAIAGLLTLGILLALVDSSAVDSSVIQTSGLFLSAAFAAGLVGDSMISMLHEQKALDWWKAHRQGIPHSYVHALVIGAGLTALTQLGFDSELSVELTLIGGLLTSSTMAIVRAMELATSRLARPRAAFIRILTPILILPFALLVQWITDSSLL